jgi:hypothetical protein
MGFVLNWEDDTGAKRLCHCNFAALVSIPTGTIVSVEEYRQLPDVDKGVAFISSSGTYTFSGVDLFPGSPKVHETMLPYWRRPMPKISTNTCGYTFWLPAGRMGANENTYILTKAGLSCTHDRCKPDESEESWRARLVAIRDRLEHAFGEDEA